MNEFVVHGRARPAGALKVGVRGDGRAFLHHRDGRELSDFKNGVRHEAGLGMRGAAPWQGPVFVIARFYFTRPQGHFGTGRNAGVLKASAPTHPTTRANGDADKLARGLLDALTGICFRDDSQVAVLMVTKHFADTGGARVEVTLGECAVHEAGRAGRVTNERSA